MSMGNKRGLRSKSHVNTAFWVEKGSVLGVSCWCSEIGTGNRVRMWGAEIHGGGGGVYVGSRMLRRSTQVGAAPGAPLCSVWGGLSCGCPA